MTVYFPHVAFTLEDVLNGKINQKNFSESERYILNFVNDWFAGKETFTFRTSGSTGVPKEITLTRTQLAYSATETMRFLFPKSPPKRLLLCLDPRLIGGTQVITRALLSEADLHIVSPTAHPLASIEDPFDLISMVPLQVASTSLADFDKVRHVLIGGAELDMATKIRLQSLTDTTFYQTYGMTETASHIALREISSHVYRPIGDISIEVDDRQCLKCRGTVTNDEWLQTNDVVEMVAGGFIWKGRADWVINSGGVKIHPEAVEETIAALFPEITCVISSLTDPLLGNKVVLVTNESILERLKASNALTRYEMPKLEVILAELPRLANDKIDRLAVRKWVIEI